MTRVYSIILIPDSSDGKPCYTVHIPDFDIGTQGHSLTDALYMARDAIYQVGLSLLEDGLPVPEPSRSVNMPEPGLFIAAVEVDFNAREASPAGVSPKLAVQR